MKGVDVCQSWDVQLQSWGVHYKVQLPEPIPTGMPTGCFIVSPELLIDDFRTPKPATKTRV